MTQVAGLFSFPRPHFRFPRRFRHGGGVFVQIDAVTTPGDSELVAVDDVVVGWSDQARRFIQAKKNQPDRREWSLSDSVLRQELIKARDQLERSDAAIVELVSRTPFGDLEKLVEESRDYDDYAAFSPNVRGLQPGDL